MFTVMLTARTAPYPRLGPTKLRAAHDSPTQNASSCILLLTHGNPLFAAISEGRNSTVELLLERGADVHAQKGYALSEAAMRGNTSIVIALLDHGIDVPRAGAHALACASLEGHSETARVLVERGADVREAHRLHQLMKAQGLRL
jgi:ankyrin repeat protein